MSGAVAAVAPRLRENRLARHVALLGLATVVSGILIGGVAGRIVMRVSALAARPEMVGRITENGNRIGEFTVGGTLVLIVFVGALGGVLASIVVVGSEPWLKWMGPARGFGFALAVLAVYAYEEPFDSIDFLILEPTSLNVAMFIGLFVVFGLTVTALFWLFDRKLPKAAVNAWRNLLSTFATNWVNESVFVWSIKTNPWTVSPIKAPRRDIERQEIPESRSETVESNPSSAYPAICEARTSIGGACFQASGIACTVDSGRLGGQACRCIWTVMTFPVLLLRIPPGIMWRISRLLGSSASTSSRTGMTRLVG